MVPPRVAVAASGGRDSTALLHCTQRQASALGIEVVALHVHHGLQPQADVWLAQVRSQCRRWGAGFSCRRLSGGPARGDSVEAWARNARYTALAEMAREADCRIILLAHHRRDQAETWLLQALRGAGAAGLAAMPAAALRGGLVWARPWLAQPPERIQAYVRRHRLHHAEDPSNQDPRYARNRLRNALWPTLTSAFPDAEVALQAAAARAQEDLLLRAEVAALDLPALQPGAGMPMPAWLALPPARRRNALHAWLHANLPQGAPQTLLARLCAELPAMSTGCWPAPGGELNLYRHQLSWRATPSCLANSTPGPVLLDLSRVGETPVPGWQGRFVVSEADSAGVPADLLRHVLARPRQAQDRFRLAAGGAARSLKKQFQARAVAAWGRHGPLLNTADGRLLFVPGLGLEASLLAPAGQPQLRVCWLPEPPPGTGRRKHRG